MLVVLVLCVCFLSPVQLDDVVSTNFVQETSKLPPVDIQIQPNNVQQENDEKLEISTPKARKSEISHPFSMNTQIENEKRTSNCPNTGLLLKILHLLTKSLSPQGIVDPNKFKDILSIIKGILEKTPLDTDYYNLYNDIKGLENRLDKHNNDGIGLPVVEDNNKLRAKISLQYDLPSTHESKCQDIFYALVNYINNAYYQVASNCLITGKCYIKDLPKILFSASNQVLGPQNQVSNQYTINNTPNKQWPSGSINSKDKGVKDIMNLLQNFKISPEMSSSNYLYNSNLQFSPQYLIPSISNNQMPEGPLDISGNNQIGSSHNNQLLTDINPKTAGDNNNIPWQNIFSTLQLNSIDSKTNQEGAKLTGKHYFDANLQNMHKGVKDMNKDVLINTPVNNIDPTLSLQNPLIQNQSSNLDVNGPNNPNVGQNQVPVFNSPPNEHFPLNSAIQNQPINADLYKQLLSSLGYSQQKLILNNPYQIQNKNGIYGILNANLGQNPILANQLPVVNPYNGGYVNPNILNNQRDQLPDLTQLGVTNAVKLNAVPNQSGVVELTYMLKRPKPAFEPLYYVKYKMPYPTFLYNLRNLLIQKPYLRNDPKQVYQELLLKSNITEASGDLENLKREEILNLISKNGTLITARILQANGTYMEEQLKIVKDLNANMSLANLNSTYNLELSEQIKNASVENFTNIAIRPYLSDALKQLQKKNNEYVLNPLVQYQRNGNYKILYPSYPTAYGLAHPQYGYMVNKNAYPLNSPFLSYLNMYPKTG